MGGHRTARPGRAGFAGGAVADREDEVHDGRAGDREFTPGLRSQTLGGQAHLPQKIERERVYRALGMAAGAVTHKATLPDAVDDRLAKNAAGRVAGAQEQDVEGPHRVYVRGFTARMKALMNLPSTDFAIVSTSIPLPVRNSRASSTR